MRDKAAIRKFVWDSMERLGIARFPRPVHGRIPNFVGAELAAKRVAELKAFKRARVVKVNPDSPQRPIREAVLRLGKTLLMPTPRLRQGFLLVDGSRLPKSMASAASTIGGAFRLGKLVSLQEIPNVDLVVVGSVAVAPDGARIGKGHGYSEYEYGILREIGALDDSVPVITTVHDIQIVDSIPIEEHDVPVDLIATPTKILETRCPYAKPSGIFWGKVRPEALGEMPILCELKKLKRA